MTASAWDRRIARAEELACTCPPAAELLRFYGEIIRFQKVVFEQLKSDARHPPVSALLPHFPALLSLVRRIGPAPVGQVAEELMHDQSQWEDLLSNSGNTGVE